MRYMNTKSTKTEKSNEKKDPYSIKSRIDALKDLCLLREKIQKSKTTKTLSEILTGYFDAFNSKQYRIYTAERDEYGTYHLKSNSNGDPIRIEINYSDWHANGFSPLTNQQTYKQAHKYDNCQVLDLGLFEISKDCERLVFPQYNDCDNGVTLKSKDKEEIYYAPYITINPVASAQNNQIGKASSTVKDILIYEISKKIKDAENIFPTYGYDLHILKKNTIKNSLNKEYVTLQEIGLIDMDEWVNYTCSPAYKTAKYNSIHKFDGFQADWNISLKKGAKATINIILQEPLPQDWQFDTLEQSSRDNGQNNDSVLKGYNSLASKILCDDDDDTDENDFLDDGSYPDDNNDKIIR